MNRKWLFVFLLIALATLIAGPAAADSPIDKRAALESDFDSLIENAQRAFGEGDFEAAIEYLVISNRLEPDPRLFLNIARSYEELGECHISLVYYEAFLADPPDDPALIERAESAMDEQSLGCRAYSRDLSGRLRFDSNPVLAEVFIDDESLGFAPTETAGLSPGTYTVRFELDGYQEHSEEIEVVADEEITVRTSLREEGEEIDEPEEPEEIEEPPEVDDEVFSLNPIAIGIASAGLAGVIAGGIFDLVLIPGVDDEWHEVRDGETDHEEPIARLAELEDKRSSYVTGAAISYIGGGLLLAGGLGWIAYDYFTAGGTDSDPYGWHVTPDVSDQGAGVLMMRRF